MRRIDQIFGERAAKSVVAEKKGRKIVVTGPYNAGKSTFVRALCRDSVSIDSEGTTVVMDYGQRRYQEMDVALFGTPGQSRFNYMIEAIAKGADGFILVVDSSFPDSWPYAITILNEIAKAGKRPYAVAANKQDLENAYPPEDVKRILSVTRPVIGTIAFILWIVCICNAGEGNVWRAHSSARWSTGPPHSSART